MQVFQRSTVLVFAFLVGTVAQAQRHSGGMQPFNRTSNPILNIEDSTTKEWTYLRLSQLKKMHRTTIEAPDPRTGVLSSFIGVALDDLLPRPPGNGFEIFKSGIFRDKVAIKSGELDPEAKLLVAYSETGKTFGQHPFSIVAKSQQRGWVILSDVAFIRLDKRQRSTRPCCQP